MVHTTIAHDVDIHENTEHGKADTDSCNSRNKVFKNKAMLHTTNSTI